MDLNWIAIFIAFMLLSTGEAKDMSVQLTPPPEELDYAFWDNDGVCLNVDISASGGKPPYTHSLILNQAKEFNDTLEIQNDKLVYCAQTPDKQYGIKIRTKDADNKIFETDLNITSSNLKVNFFPNSSSINENIHYYILPDKTNFSLNLFKVGGIGQTNLNVTSNGIKFSPELPAANYSFNNNTLIVNPNGLQIKSTYYLKVLVQDSKAVKAVERQYYLAFSTPDNNGNNQGKPGNGNCNGQGQGQGQGCGNGNAGAPPPSPPPPPPTAKIKVTIPNEYKSQNSSATSYKAYVDEQFKMDFSLQLPPTNFIQDVKHFYKSNLAPALNFAFDPLMNKTNLIINAASMNLDNIYLFDFEFEDNTSFKESITAGFKIENFDLRVVESSNKPQMETDLVKQRIGNSYLLNKVYKIGESIDFKVIINEPGQLQNWKYLFTSQNNLEPTDMPLLEINKDKSNISNFKWIPKKAGTFLFDITVDDDYSQIMRTIEVKVVPDTQVKLVLSPELEDNTLIHFIDEPKIELSVGAKDGVPNYKYNFSSNPSHTGMSLKDGKFIFEPKINDIREYSVTFKVEDSLATQDERTISLVVSDIALQFDPAPNKAGNTYALSLGENVDLKVLYPSKNITKIDYNPGTLPGGQFIWDSFTSVLSLNTNDIGLGNHTAQFTIYDEINEVFRVYDLYFEIDELGSYEAHNGLILRHDEVSIMEPGTIPLAPKVTNNKIKWYDTVQVIGSEQFMNENDSITGDYALCNIYNISDLNVANIEEKVTKSKFKMEQVVFTKKLTNDLLGASFHQGRCRKTLKKLKKYSGTYSSMLVGCHTDKDNISFECSKEEPPE